MTADIKSGLVNPLDKNLFKKQESYHSDWKAKRSFVSFTKVVNKVIRKLSWCISSSCFASNNHWPFHSLLLHITCLSPRFTLPSKHKRPSLFLMLWHVVTVSIVMYWSCIEVWSIEHILSPLLNRHLFKHTEKLSSDIRVVLAWKKSLTT